MKKQRKAKENRKARLRRKVRMTRGRLRRREKKDQTKNIRGEEQGKRRWEAG